MNLVKQSFLFRIVATSKMLVLHVLFSNCAIGPVHGWFYTNTEFPGEYNPQNNVLATKISRGCATSYLGLVSLGDASAGSVAKIGGIEKIATIDHSTFSVLGPVYQSYCTIVYGE